MLGQGETIKDYQHRFPILLGAIVLFFGLLSIRLFFLQVYRGDVYRKFSEQNSLRQEKIPGPRGQILDREGRILVDNRLQLDVTLIPQFAPKVAPVLETLAQIVDEPLEKIEDRYKRARVGSFKFQPLTLLRNADWDSVVQIESLKSELPGVDVESRIRRTYLHKSVGSPLFGYLSEVSKEEIKQSEKRGDKTYDLGDWKGRSGLEKQWEKYLRGVDGVRYVEVDAHGRRVSGPGDSTQSGAQFLNLPAEVPPKSGNNLVLTLDEDLQLEAAKSMYGKMGAVVALDVRTGEVLAMISQPGLDPTDWGNKGADLWSGVKNNPYSPLLNKTIQEHFPSGSTFKVFTALAALEKGIFNENTAVFCPGYYKFGRRIYNCHIQGGHGAVTLRQAIEGSCDVYFYTIASRLGIDAISKMASNFGLGSKTGIELEGEVPGTMPTESWKLQALKQEWTPGETLSAAIGQGYNLVTPLQIALAYATLVNGGNLYRPYVVSKIETETGEVVRRFSPELISNYKVNPKHLEAIKEALSDVANSPRGTAHSFLRTPNKLISGKSGTAQVMSFNREDLFKPCQNLPFEKRHHAWFVGYAPRENPEIVVSVLGMHECGGSRNASPVVRAVIEKYWQKKKAKESLLGPQPSEQAKLNPAQIDEQMVWAWQNSN